MKNWGEIASYSELLAAQEIKQSFDAGDLTDVEAGLNQLIDTMAHSEQRALQSQLTQLMMHVIKWQIQPEKRIKSWWLSIENARLEIDGLRDYTPSLNETFIQRIWPKALKDAQKLASLETDLPTTDVQPTWEAVFDLPYTL